MPVFLSIPYAYYDLTYHVTVARTKNPLTAFTVNEIARVCRVDLATARRWKRQAVCPPQTAIMVLAGDLGCFSPYWRGWVIRGETLISPEGWTTTRGEAMSVQLLHQQIAILKAELRKAQETLSLEEQPSPSSWELASG